MKAPYFIDFTKNEIVVTKKFRDAAGVRDSQEFKTMMELRKLGMEIRLQKSPARKKAASQITYKKMIKHINCLADADYYMAEFEKTRELSKGELNPYRFVLRWYEATFPNHAGLPEYDENLNVINTPADHAVA